MDQALLEALFWNVRLLAYAVLAYDALLVIGLVFDLCFRKKEAITRLAIEKTVMHFLARKGFVRLVEQYSPDTSKNSRKPCNRHNAVGKQDDDKN